MQLGRVAGTLVASRKEALLSGMKFLVVRRIEDDNSDSGSFVVAVIRSTVPLSAGAGIAS